MSIGQFSTRFAGYLKAAIFGRRRSGARRRETPAVSSLGVYTLHRKLGEGGMGEVYLAEHQLLKRRCAVKLIRATQAGDAKAIARFQAEVQAMARLTHPNTVSIFDYGITADGTYFYAMEFLPGMNLEEIVNRFGPLPPERVVHLLLQVCSALAEAHATGLVHRDIKPGNIFAAERGGIYDIAKLLDFGLVKSVAANDESVGVTLDEAFVGSPLYAPPESIVGSGKLDARCDIYSLGATAYHLLTGQPVFQGDNLVKVMFKHANQDPTAPTDLRTDIPVELAEIIMKCLEKRPEDRFQDVQALEEALSRTQLEGRWTQERARTWWTEHSQSVESERIKPDETATQVLAGDTKKSRPTPVRELSVCV